MSVACLQWTVTVSFCLELFGEKVSSVHRQKLQDRRLNEGMRSVVSEGTASLMSALSMIP